MKHIAASICYAAGTIGAVILIIHGFIVTPIILWVASVAVGGDIMKERD